MITVDCQIHGYRQGHQLLAGSIQLPKVDQSLVDRLSDVAGPLRPKELFEPYLSAYPLPSGERYVLARTWQDVTVKRAGCVRTLSLIIPAADWAAAESLAPFLELLRIERLPDDIDAIQKSVALSAADPLPPAFGFRAGELLEALFLEDEQPVAIFDAPQPDLIAVRLLTALWPSIRRRFALSTFALSPRKVSGRDFDLVFVPKDARSKFTDWNGRRVDGRSNQDARHRWTGAIVSRVFEQPFPQLLTDKEISLIGGGESDADNAATLRIALLWDELLDKLERTPMAALGLLDIANSGMVEDSLAVGSLEPAIVNAVRRASVDLPTTEAWDFLGAIARKLQGRSMQRGRVAVRESAAALAKSDPEGAVALLRQPDPKGVTKDLLPSISSGIADTFNGRTEKALVTAPPEIFGRLVAEGGRLVECVAKDEALVHHLAAILPNLEPPLFGAVSVELLPYLVDDWQLPAARPLLAALDGAGLALEIHRLGVANDFAASQLTDLIVDRAREAGGREMVMIALTGVPQSERRDALLAKTLDPKVADVTWLLSAPSLSADVSLKLLESLLRKADDRQLSTILNDPDIGDEVIQRIEGSRSDLLHRAIFNATLPIDIFIHIVRVALPKADAATKVKIVEKALGQCLIAHFEGDEVNFIAMLLEILGERLDGAWAARIGLSREIEASVASRNMVAFRKASHPACLKIVSSIADIAQVLHDRRAFDLDAAAAEACAHMMFEAEKIARDALLIAAGRLLPILMRQRRDPVALMIVAAFPVIYRELAKEADVPDLLKFVPFLDWDRCKAARHELVSAFMSSVWAPGDLALTACRCGDVAKILRWTAKSYGGNAYINRMAEDLKRLPEPCRQSVDQTIATIRSDWAARYDWRD